MKSKRFLRPTLVGLSGALLVAAYILPDPPDPKGFLTSSNPPARPSASEGDEGSEMPAPTYAPDKTEREDSPDGPTVSRSSDVAEVVECGAFIIRDEVTVPGPPEAAFDRFVEVGEWWDHRFSESPDRFYLEPKVGGGFWEIFDDEGNGVLHATVIYAERGKALRFDGPLGLSGSALKMVHTLEFDAVGDSTRVRLDLHASGEVREGWAETVEGVWRHFLERFQAYAEGRLTRE